ARIWEDEVTVLHAPMELSAWFADKLQRTCSLVFMPDSAQRTVDPNYASGITSLSDGFPYLIISQASLADLNARMATPVPMERFRPNIVIDGGEPYQEDAWKEVSIGAARFSVVKPCARCVIITTDQTTGERGAEPLRTLASYRRRPGAEHKVDFGMNAMAKSGDVVRVGDLVRPLTDR
ncbi:MAG TPA: MOSC domain-containing protein, partial [Flavobacteriales bacterium]|nr:MOSC domain-containing protein [Flavobacteriales bacterium]